MEGRKIIDNILIAQEIVKDYDKDKGKPRCALKIDIMKAFDSVNWNFVPTVMHVLGLPEAYIQWYSVSLSTPRYSVKINGCSEGFFVGKKEVRQGDPLSSYLFNLCMEVLSKLLNSSTREGRIAYHPKRGRLDLTHFCFAYSI